MKHPYLCLWAVSIALLITPFFTSYDMVVNIGDTYYVFQSKHLYILLAMVYFVAALPPLAVKFFKLPVAKPSMVVHAVGSIALLVIAIAGIYHTKYIAGIKSRMQQVIEGFDEELRTYTIVLSCTALFIVLQIFLTVQIIVALFGKHRTAKQT